MNICHLPNNLSNLFNAFIIIPQDCTLLNSIKISPFGVIIILKKRKIECLLKNEAILGYRVTIEVFIYKICENNACKLTTNLLYHKYKRYLISNLII